MMDTGQMYGASTQREYAGFWLRVVAAIIDGIILAIVELPIGFVVNLIAAVIAKGAGGSDSDAATGIAMVIAIIVNALINLVIYLAYFGAFECTKGQTPGKMALGLLVTDVNGNRISFLHAVGRNAGKIISGLILYVGFIMCGFTERKQCLHDMMAGTLVVKKPR